MARNEDDQRMQNPTAQSIPLRDLPSTHERSYDGSPSHVEHDNQFEPGHGRTQSWIDRARGTVKYARIGDRSPVRSARLGALQTITGSGDSDADEGAFSPISPGGFAQAHVGISYSFNEPAMDRQRRPTIITTAVEDDLTEPVNTLSPQYESDQTPLTGENRLRPVAKNSPGTADRLSRKSTVRWMDGSSPSSGRGRSSRLGDDLPALNTSVGVHRQQSDATGILRFSTHAMDASEHSRSRSPSPSPLARANHMLRGISQRVVNISNDTEIVDQNIRRKSTAARQRSSATSYPGDLEAAAESSRPQDMPSEAPSEKAPSVHDDPEPFMPVRYSNPLRGKSLGVFGPENSLRKFCMELLTHPMTEPIILVLIVLQTVLLAVNSAADAQYLEPRSRQWGRSSFDYAIFGLFVVYTLEIAVRVIVSGFIINPTEYSVLDRSQGFRKGAMRKLDRLFSLQYEPDEVSRRNSAEFHPTIVRTFTGMPNAEGPGSARQKQRVRLSRRAYLRHSFNRLDFVAVVSYWISFVLQVTQYEARSHMYIFSMLSCLRVLRLLGLTAGTSIILRSLKKAAPLLANVAFLIGFFWLLFAIIGIQSFKSSFRRTCVWVGDDGSGQNYTRNIAPDGIQFCGGYLDATSGQAMPWLKADGSNGTNFSKGFLCPQNSLCVEGSNPYNGTLSFDNVAQSLQLVFVVISSNTWSDLMYYLADSDYLIAALFFAVGIVILSLWLVNLLVAVITSSFQIIREESKQSAFTTDQVQDPPSDDKVHRESRFRKWFKKTEPLWVVLIACDLVIAALRSATMSPRREHIIMNTETAVTFILLVEIILRFASDWRNFFKSRRNWLDLLIAVITTIMQLPPIRNSGEIYAWLTFFQIIRIYRVVLAVRVTRELVMVVFGNIVGLLNLMVFVFLFTFLAAIMATQLFRGDLPPEDNSGNTIFIQFFDIWNSFIGMYIILSSENWTSMMYNIQEYNLVWGTAWIGAMFCITWYIMANLILLNMFIAVIQESFDISEDEKRLQQVKAFLRKKELAGNTATGVSFTSIFKFGRESLKHRDANDFGGAAMEQLLKDAVVSDFLDEIGPSHSNRPASMHLKRIPTAPVPPSFLRKLWYSISNQGNKNDPNPFYTDMTVSRADEEFDAKAMAQRVVSTAEGRSKIQRQYLNRHPNYNVSLWIFKNSNPIRKVCQRIVGPSRGGERVEGTQPWKPLWYFFSAFTYLAIVGMVILACITTPLYQREHLRNTDTWSNWILWTDFGFAVFFLIEALIKIIADGFFYTPYAFFRNVWGVIDVVVLVTLWINVFTQMFRDDSIARGIGAFKALRALRLLSITDTARDTFHSVIIVGGYKILSAAFVSLSLLVPFAILGLNLFNGKMQECNDGAFGYSGLSQCVGEFNSTPFNWPVLAPRTVSNPSYSFDDFGSSLFILFQIVSQEGWTGVMQSGMSITGRGLQPQNFASQGNAVYFIVFNLLGAVFVLTLFISVFMRNYTEQTGVAYLTAEQRSWLELRKLLKQIQPAKRSMHDASKKWKKWCYDQASKKRGRWARGMTCVLMLHLILLLVEYYPEPSWWENVRTSIFLFLTLIYMFNIGVRITGLTWTRFRRSSWDLYSLPAVGGSFITSILALTPTSSRTEEQLHKLFLVSVTLLLIPRNNQLDQLFKTAAASLPLIGNLLATWFVLFLVYAIALTQAFSLTRFGGNEDGNINFRTVPKALILLFRMSIGEGWNDIMEDFATITPPFCVKDGSFYDSDCGSAGWARILFVSWNIISMYIFVSLFVSLIFESFSYVYQRSGGLAIISRDEIRRFKQAWSEFDPDGTGYISKEQFPRLLGELSGVFQMRIYEGDFTVRNIIEDCTIQPGDPVSAHRRVVAGIDLDRLNERTSLIPVQEIRQRRIRMNIFYHEMMLSADPDRGISFTSCLMILAHYNVITDSKNLRLEEFLRRRARLQRVEQSIQRDTVRGFLETVLVLRKNRPKITWREKSRVDAPPALDIPEIFVDHPDDSASSAGAEPADFTELAPLTSPRRPSVLPKINTTMSQNDSRRSAGSLSPAPSPGNSPTLSPNRGSRLHSVDTSYYGARRSPPTTPTLGGRHSRQPSTVSQNGEQGIMASFDSSAWGESLRRSFTTKRRSEQE